LLDLLHLVFGVVVYADWHLIGIIVQIDEAIVKEEATIALLAVGIVDLLTSLDVIEGLDDEATAVICVVPRCLPWALVIKHVGICDEAISLDTFNLDAKDATRDHHANL
jgi:hypothetical protein